MEPADIIPRIFLAVLLGALVGLEREYTQKSAGLRTHILVTLGATVFTCVSSSDFYYGLHYLSYRHAGVEQDPTRVAAQIVSGIGFIGGGAVLRYGNTVRGLTTAASLWAMASIGMLVGVGQFRVAIIATLVIFLVLFSVGKAERNFFHKSVLSFNRLKINLLAQAEEVATVQAWMETHYQERIVEARVQTDAHATEVDIDYVLTMLPGKTDLGMISQKISSIPGVLTSSVKSYYEVEERA